MSDQDAMETALAEVIDERTRQIKKWGIQLHDHSTWALILGEEVGEVSQAILNQLHDGITKENAAELKKEIIQVAAVAVAWLECIESTK
jgi:NTP pyrophosphatase (non-canonical NTP hydrolase)